MAESRSTTSTVSASPRGDGMARRVSRMAEGRSTTSAVSASPRGDGMARRVSRVMARQLSGFVGVEASEARAVKWENRRKHFAHAMGGRLKPQYAEMKFVDQSGTSRSRTVLPMPQRRKQSVASMTLSGLGSVIRKKPPPQRPRLPSAFVGAQSISATQMEKSKRVVGVGVIGQFLGRRIHRAAFTKDVKSQLDDFDDHRPYFTYWVTFVHILVFIVATTVYGLAPFGVGTATERKVVRLSSLAREVKEYVEDRNLWLGPRQSDLIHLGARYSPCMRVDPNLHALLAEDMKKENQSACCVRNDGVGCVQKVEARCDILSTWKKWKPGNTGPGGRLSGSVCGQDPAYCLKPASAEPFGWPDSIVDWPLCLKTRKQNLSGSSSQDRHMSCELLGHPCCFGIRGECWITTREHCDLIRGRYHSDKYLCSQAKCLKQICGMIPFSHPDKPDQVYRLWTSLFLHAGLIHLLVSIFFQMWIMRDIEKLTGAMRLSIIYIGSGIAGNLASSTFMPYYVEAGPSGCQFGVVACLLVEVLQSFQMYSNPQVAIFKMVVLAVLLFLFGLLPWFDNWAHIFGFIFGFLLAFALLPYVSFGKFDRRRKILTIIVCLGTAIGVFFVLIMIFYMAPLTECKFCKYFTCIPFTQNFCLNRDISLSNRSNYDSDFA